MIKKSANVINLIFIPAFNWSVLFFILLFADMYTPAISILILLFASYLVHRLLSRRWTKPKKAMQKKWKILLAQEVPFYAGLNIDQKHLFEYKVMEFLANVKITPIDTAVDILDKLLIAASAVIPIFAFPEWKYYNLDEILLYPTCFNEDFETTGKDRRILGMVGTGYMEGKMILSKQALRHGFQNESDKRNTAIHEFVHLIDKADGVIDGIPSLLMEKQYVLPWFDMIDKKIHEIEADRSDINPYGATNRIEFFAVLCEYFFECPKLLQRKHPKLYDYLEMIFHQRMTEREFVSVEAEIGRNDPCPCESGKKFKKCCGSVV